MQRAVPASFVKVAALAGRPVFTRIGRYHALRTWARFPSVLQTASFIFPSRTVLLKSEHFPPLLAEQAATTGHC